MIAAAGASIILIALFGANFSWQSISLDIEKLIMLIVFIVILTLPKTKNIHPLLLVALAALGGIIFRM